LIHFYKRFLTNFAEHIDGVTSKYVYEIMNTFLSNRTFLSSG